MRAALRLATREAVPQWTIALEPFRFRVESLLTQEAGRQKRGEDEHVLRRLL